MFALNKAQGSNHVYHSFLVVSYSSQSLSQEVFDNNLIIRIGITKLTFEGWSRH